MNRRRRLGPMILALAALLLTGPSVALSAQAPDWTLDLDGVLETGELFDTKTPVTGGGAVWMSRRADVLTLRFRTPPIFVVSVCVGSARSVAVLHASAALGRVDYLMGPGGYRRQGDFVWRMRETEMTAEARALRAEHYEEHGWVATTARMGSPGEVEFRVDLARMPEGADRIAAGLMPSATPESMIAWPAGAEACADSELVPGPPPEQLDFAPERWLTIPEPEEGEAPSRR